MGERTDQIEQQINRTREDLGENFNELEQKVKSAFDWRTQFEERPMTMLAIAFGGGVIASALLPSRSDRRRRYVEDRREYRRSESAKDDRKPVQASADTTNGKHTNGKQRNSSEGVDALKGALITVAASRLGGLVGDLLTGYRDELRKLRQTQHK
jgi:hypothetical protein